MPKKCARERSGEERVSRRAVVEEFLEFGLSFGVELRLRAYGPIQVAVFATGPNSERKTKSIGLDAPVELGGAFHRTPFAHRSPRAPHSLRYVTLRYVRDESENLLFVYTGVIRCDPDPGSVRPRPCLSLLVGRCRRLWFR